MTSLFFSYSHKDEDLRDQLEVHLAALKREGAIDVWHDRRIPAGDEIDHGISDALERADVIYRRAPRVPSPSEAHRTAERLGDARLANSVMPGRGRCEPAATSPFTASDHRFEPLALDEG